MRLTATRRSVCVGRGFKKNEVAGTRKADIKKAEFLAAGEACKTLFWSIAGKTEL